MVERALAAAIIGVGIVLVIPPSPARADGVAAQERCRPGTLGATPVTLQQGRAIELNVGPTTALVSGRPVEWQFTVTNRASRAANLLFHSSMFGDVYLYPTGRQAALSLRFRDGPVYYWSERRGFAPAAIPAALPAHSEWRCSLAPSILDVSAGRYLLVAYLNATPFASRVWHPIAFRRYVDVAPAR
jgi:hypothetical protein